MAFATKARAMAARSVRGRPGNPFHTCGRCSSTRIISRVVTNCCCLSVRGPRGTSIHGKSAVWMELQYGANISLSRGINDSLLDTASFLWYIYQRTRGCQERDAADAARKTETTAPI